MIAKIVTGTGSAGALDYGLENSKKEKDVLNEEKAGSRKTRDALRFPGVEASSSDPGWEEGRRARVIGGNLVGKTQSELRRDFKWFEERRPEVRNTVHHATISAPPGVRPTIAQWQEIADEYIRVQGYERSGYVVIQHRDCHKKGLLRDHVHIYASNVTIDGEVVNQFRSKERAEQLMQSTRERYGLPHVEPSTEAVRRNPRRGEQERFERTGKMSTRMSLQDSIDGVLKSSPTTTEFVARLEQRGIRIKVEQHENRTGILYERDGQVMKGSNLGNGYTFQGLQERGMSYVEARDVAPLKDARFNFLQAQLAREEVKVQKLRGTPSESELTNRLFGEAEPEKQIERLTNPKQLLEVLGKGNATNQEMLEQIASEIDEYYNHITSLKFTEQKIAATKAELNELGRDLLSLSPPQPSVVCLGMEPEGEVIITAPVSELQDVRSLPAFTDFSPIPASPGAIPLLPFQVEPPPQAFYELSPYDAPYGMDSLQQASALSCSPDANGLDALADATGYKVNDTNSAEDIMREAVAPQVTQPTVEPEMPEPGAAPATTAALEAIEEAVECELDYEIDFFIL